MQDAGAGHEAENAIELRGVVGGLSQQGITGMGPPGGRHARRSASVSMAATALALSSAPGVPMTVS